MWSYPLAIKEQVFVHSSSVCLASPSLSASQFLRKFAALFNLAYPFLQGFELNENHLLVIEKPKLGNIIVVFFFFSYKENR